MIKKLLYNISIFSVMTYSFADDFNLNNEISLGTGLSKDNIGIYRLGIKKSFKESYLEGNYGWVGGYYEVSFNYWDRVHENIVVFAASPVFVYYIGNKNDKVTPYLEAGIGVSFLSDTDIRTRNMTTNFNFEDRIGMGIRMEHYDYSARYMHYSNASIVNPNDGIDIFIFTVSHMF